jgi:hypothetical protein
MPGGMTSSTTRWPKLIAALGIVKLLLVTILPGVVLTVVMYNLILLLVSIAVSSLSIVLDVEQATAVAEKLGWMLEALAAMYLTDFTSGTAHMFLDYQILNDDELRWHTEYSIPDVSDFEQTSELFLGAEPWDQFIWDFQVHHDAIYPASKNEFALGLEILMISSIVYVPCSVIAYFGLIPSGIAHILLLGWFFGSFTQKTHFDAHARNRDLWVNPVVRFLQDTGFLLTAEEHKRHHEEFDCNFCIFNGWANPVINRVAKTLVANGILHSEPPTISTRRERKELEKVSTDTGGVSVVDFKELTDDDTIVKP